MSQAASGLIATALLVICIIELLYSSFEGWYQTFEGWYQTFGGSDQIKLDLRWG